ncbi:MAG: signal peptidase II [Kineosporiaceae bacterium]
MSISEPAPAPEPRATVAAGPRPRLMAVCAGVFALALAVDQITKAWAESALAGGRVIEVLDPVMQLRLVRNPGAAFSFATNATWIFTIIASVVVVAVAVAARRLGSAWWAVALGLLAGGACGNLVDRLVRPPAVGRGHVIDFLEWPNFPVFNVADSCVVTAAIMIAVAALRGVSLDGRRHD